MINPISNVISLFSDILSSFPFAITAFFGLFLAVVAIIGFINLFLR